MTPRDHHQTHRRLTVLRIGGLNAGTDLWIRVDSVNEGGVTEEVLIGPAAQPNHG